MIPCGWMMSSSDSQKDDSNTARNIYTNLRIKTLSRHMLFISMPSAWQLVERVFAPDIRQLGKNQFFGNELIRELRMKTPDEIRRYQKIINNKEAILNDN